MNVAKLDKVKDVLAKVDVDTVLDNVAVVVSTVGVLNKTNTSTKADNIQRGVNDVIKVLGVLQVLKGLLNVFKRK